MNLIFISKKEDENKKVGEFLKCKGISSIVLHRLRQTEGLILCNGETVFTNHRIKKNDRIEIQLVEKTNENIKLEPINPEILFEDEYLLIVNKPALVSTIPNGERPHLAGRVLYYLQNSENFCGTFMPINRLDIDTSGIVLIAKSCFVQFKMQANFKKTYLAIVNGKTNKFGTITAPIGVDDFNRNKRKVDPSGKPSITKYKRIKYSKKLNLSLVKIKLITGRTHQIRVHFAHIGHSLFCDKLYGTELCNVSDKLYGADLGNVSNKLCGENFGNNDLINRTALHSYKIMFRHPITNKKIKIICNPPLDFENVKKALYR